MKNLFKKYPLVFIVLGGLLIITIVLVVVALSLKDTVEVEIKVAPASATVLVDGKSYQNGTFRISSGTHNIHIEKEGFTSKDYTFDTGTNNKLYDYLLQSDGSYTWYLSHEEDALILTSIGDYEQNLKSINYNSKYPIIESLPIIYAHYDENYDYTEYRIDGGSFSGCNTDFCLKVTDTTGNNLESAKEKIREAGFNPDNYQILYEYTPIEKLE